MTTTKRDDSSRGRPDAGARTRLGQLWLDAPLRRKLLIVILLIAFVWLPPIVTALAINAQLDEARGRERATSQTSDALEALQDAILGAQAEMQTYLVLGFSDTRYVENYRRATAELPALVDEVRDDLPPELAELGRDVEASVDALVENLDTFTDYGASGSEPADVSDDPDIFELNPGLVDGLVTLLETTPAADADIDALHSRLDARLADERREIDHLQQLLVVGTLATMVAALVVAAGGTYVVNTGGVSRIERLTQNADRFIEDLPLLPYQVSADEIGQLTDKMLFAGELLDSRRAQAVAATRAKDDFLSRVSHELKTPLTAMIGCAQLLADDPDLSPASREDAAHIVTAGHHLHGLVQELLDTRAIEAGKLALDPGPVPVREAADAALSLVASMPASLTRTLANDCPDHLAVTADRRRLGEVLLNLLSNAVKYNHDGGRVELSAHDRGDAVRISVTDTGPGIAPDDQARLFEPFERLGAADSDVEGSGVGLALTKKVVEAMGGTIGVDSAPGRGSTFWFDLPTAAAAAHGAGTAPEHDQTLPAPTGEPREAPAADGPARPPRSSRDNPLVPPVIRARTRLGQRWLDAALRRKLLIIVTLIALVSLPPIAMALVFDARLDDARSSRQATAETVEELHDLDDSILGAYSAIQRYTVLGFTDPRFIEEHRTAREPIPAQLAALRDGIDRDLAADARALEAAVGTMLEDLDEIIAYGESRPQTPGVTDDPAVFELDDTLIDALLATVESAAAVDDAVSSLENRIDARLVADRDEVDRLEQLLVWATLASMIASLAVAAGGTYLVTRGVVQRIERLSENADRYIRGDPLLPARASRDEVGQLTGMMLFAGELLNARRQQAIAATRAKDDFLSRVSHELKTPLTAMIGFAQLLEEDTDLSPESRGDAEQIVTGGEHLHGLIEELLDIKAIEAGKLAMSIEPVRVGQSADDAISVVRSMPESSTITITTECPEDAVVAADRRRLREVLLNLLTNAVKYNRSGGHVGIFVEPRGDAVRISVTDTGPGIAPEDQARLFQPFERLAAADSDVEGSGVGLALTKHVVEALGGAIGVDSALGRGSTFWFTLPTAAAGEPSHDTPVASGRTRDGSCPDSTRHLSR
jgi:signal transduction histidine kinase